MSFEVAPNGLDREAPPSLDSLGKLYVSISVVWTAMIVCGAGFLLYNRHLPALRVRNTYVWVSALAFLHTYWVLCWLAYVLKNQYPCVAEYWIMSIWLPFGIALYQVNGMQLLQVADLQTRLLHSNGQRVSEDSKSRRTNPWWKLSGIGFPDILSPLQRIGIVVGLILQVVVTSVVFLLSRKFHESWGVVGDFVDEGECRKSWEWLPSILWQFIWSWIYAPYLLWKVRKIHDLHGWRLQTIVCCIAGLPGTPMWLLALYSPDFSGRLAEISQYFIPPLWFTPGIAAMEASIIFIPCIVVMRSRRLQNETMQQILDWERHEKPGTSVNSESTYVQSIADRYVPSPTPKSKAKPVRNELYSMKALEKALATNIYPLLRFSALKEFSGENIAFLKHVQDWKANWTGTCSQNQPPPRSFLGMVSNKNARHNNNPQPSTDPDTLRHQQFALALEIYVSFIDPHYSDFPLNISSQQLKDLESIFSHAASALDVQAVEENAVTPFDSTPYPYPVGSEGGIAASEQTWAFSNADRDRDAISISSTASTSASSSSSSSNQSTSPTTFVPPPSTNLLDLQPRLSPDFPVPSCFGAHVFDDAHRAVKYAVLTNTWPRFVKEGLAAGMADGSGGSDTSRWSPDLERGRHGQGTLGLTLTRINNMGVWARTGLSRATPRFDPLSRSP